MVVWLRILICSGILGSSLLHISKYNTKEKIWITLDWKFFGGKIFCHLNFCLTSSSSLWLLNNFNLLTTFICRRKYFAGLIFSIKDDHFLLQQKFSDPQYVVHMYGLNAWMTVADTLNHNGEQLSLKRFHLISVNCVQYYTIKCTMVSHTHN